MSRMDEEPRPADSMSAQPTLIKPPPEDPNKAPIENLLEVTELQVLGPNIFTNTRPPWHPPGARGIYGGAVIAMCLSAAQHTVPDDFTVHSCHCYFLLAGSSSQPIFFHVEQTRDGRSFATRTVQARQRGRCIFTTTISFARDQPAAAAPQVRHAAPMPPADSAGRPLRPPADDEGEGDGEEEDDDEDDEAAGSNGAGGGSDGPGPFRCRRIDVVNRGSARAHDKRTRQWFRARGAISAGGGRRAHLAALAYASDSYFVGTVARIHGLWLFPFPAGEVPPPQREAVRRRSEWEGMGADLEAFRGRPAVGMMVSLDHSIYFHEPAKVRADEWMLSEMESPWAGDGRGVVAQRIFSKDGTLLATCMQEGIVRLREDGGGHSRDGGSKL